MASSTSRTQAGEEKIRVAVVIPARNEAASVARVVAAVRDALQAGQLIASSEIIVVDDGSTDGTGELAAAAGARVIAGATSGGYGAALKRGVRNSRATFVCFLDADGTYPAEALSQLVRALETGADQVIGARRPTPGGGERSRRLVKGVLRRVAALFAGAPVADLNSGMRGLAAIRFHEVVDLLPNGFSLTTSLTMAGLLGGWRVEWLPIPYYPRTGRSKFQPLRDGLRLLTSLLRSVVYFAPMRLFFPIAFALGVLAVALGGWDLFVERNLTDKTVLMSLAALEVVMLGLLGELIVRRR